MNTTASIGFRHASGGAGFRASVRASVNATASVRAGAEVRAQGRGGDGGEGAWGQSEGSSE